MSAKPMHAGRLRQVVRIEVPTKVKDSGGQPVKGWAELCTVRACVEAAAASEAWAGERGLRAEASEVVTVRHRADVADAGPTIRLVVVTQGNRVLNAVGVERDEKGVWLTIPCKGADKRAAG